ncbi:hypothetical protein I4U23_022454 [Adineta vaga]|nr:hypothetical protein I4U23_022454 [Adineta vaga]
MDRLLSNLIIILGIFSNSNAWQPFYNLYNTDMITNDFDHDCFYSTIFKSVNIHERSYRIQQNVEYCIRTTETIVIDINEQAISSILTFDELKKRNITSADLMRWSSPIDIVERYEYFYKQMNLHHWIDFLIVLSHDQSFEKDTTLTCYMHMKYVNINPSLICLDWREICDGKIDCLNDGEDEKYCLELEINRCEENEYQCRNGMCIDEEFFLDESIEVISLECFDGSDEVRPQLLRLCARDESFLCGDTLCLLDTSFNCGDGTCISIFTSQNLRTCANNRNQRYNYLFDWNNPVNEHYSHCFTTLMCVSDSFLLENFDRYCKNLCNNVEECTIQTLRKCPSTFIAPTFPMWYSHVQFGYFSNRTSVRVYGCEPDFVCCDKNLCSHVVPTFTMDNYTCLHINRSNFSTVKDVYEIFQSCDYTFETGNETNCIDSTMLRCVGTNKCIPKRRIMDGISDCYHAFDESLAANSCSLNDKYRFQCISEQKCIVSLLVNDKRKHCIGGEDESNENSASTNIHKLPFSGFCDKKVDIFFWK